MTESPFKLSHFPARIHLWCSIQAQKIRKLKQPFVLPQLEYLRQVLQLLEEDYATYFATYVAPFILVVAPKMQCQGAPWGHQTREIKTAIYNVCFKKSICLPPFTGDFCNL